MIVCLIIRTNRSLKRYKINEKADSFVFEGGTYYVRSDRVLLEKKLFTFKPILLYKEGIPEPLALDNIKKILNVETGEEDETVLIDAKSIHNLTSRELLSVLTKTSFSRIELFIMVMLILNIMFSCGVIALVVQLGN